MTLPNTAASRLLRHRVLGPLLLLGVLAVAYRATTPLEINGDGVGYIKRLADTTLAPGHLLYLPLARIISGGGTPAEAVTKLRLLSLCCVLLALLVCYLAARRRLGLAQAALLTLMLGASQAVFRAAREVETYGPALLLCAIAFYAATRSCEQQTRSTFWAGVAGAACGAGALFHLALALLGPALLVALFFGVDQGRRLRASAAAAAFGLLAFIPVLHLCALRSGISGWPSLISWLQSADHGIPYPLGPATPLVAIWGLARSLVYAPYPYQAEQWLVLAAALLAIATLVAWTSALAIRRQPSAPLVMSTPLLLFGLLFYPSDTERWVFVLPALCLAGTLPRTRELWVLPIAMLVYNISAGQPNAAERLRVQRAEASELLLSSNDLLVAPGHGWTEQVGLRRQRVLQRYLLIFETGKHRSLQRAISTMHQRIEHALARNQRVFVARLRDHTDQRGFKELARFGLSRADYEQLFTRYRLHPTMVSELAQIRR
ncbi:MAG: glycosyltransferase family 39 protein [Deltaproteobacteria bacterium]|nr:glycosyltransferase family 39 protein [Deltaproteobacteria bacterium]